MSAVIKIFFFIFLFLWSDHYRKLNKTRLENEALFKYLNGEYGAKEIYAGVPVIIGSQGVEKIIELKLTNEEKENFERSIEAVKDLYDAAKKIDKDL